MAKTGGAYKDGLETAAYFNQPRAGFLSVSGRDRLDFLQRQTTNDLRQLTANRAVSTVLTSPTARILDLLNVVEEDQSLGLVTLPGRAADTNSFLRSRIFFSDQVTVNDVSKDTAQILFFGPRKDSVLSLLGLEQPELDQVVLWAFEDCRIKVLGQKILGGPGCLFLGPVASLNPITTAFDESGAVPVTPEDFEILRVEAGQPGSDGELVAAYTPLEVGLGGMVSDSKGCYTGQEIIARQITYDKVTKNLAGIKLDNWIAAGAEIKAGGKSVGKLTSIVQSPRYGAIGLALLRRQHNQAGTSLSVIGKDGASTNGEVVPLPFK